MMRASTRVKLPAGFGTIRYLGAGRRNPYAVHPASARGIRPPAICYVSEWHIGVAVLAAWNSGTYVRGMEVQITAQASESRLRVEERDEFCSRILLYFRAAGWKCDTELKTAAGDDTGKERPVIASGAEDAAPSDKQNAAVSMAPQPAALQKNPTVGEVLERYYEYKFGSGAAKKLSAATAAHVRVIAKKLAPIRERRLEDLTIDDLQNLVNDLPNGRTMVEKTILLIKQLYQYAISRELCSRNPARYLVTPDLPAHVHHQDFTDAELAALWTHAADPVVRMILIMCYSGFRVSAYLSLRTDQEAGFFQGGIKTAAGKGRIVPIHSAIAPLVREALREDGGYLCGWKIGWFCRRMKRCLKELGIDNESRHHTPHSCRHTFSRLCESWGVREADRRRMMGHSFGSDLTNGVYGHRTLEELRAEIEKIRRPQLESTPVRI